MKSISLFIWLTTMSLLSAAAVPLEVELAKNAFEQEMADFPNDQIVELNAKYVTGLAAARERAQSRGDLDEVVALSLELESIEKTGEPSDEASAEGGEFENLRGIYTVEITQIDEARQAAFRLAVAGYEKNLNALVAEFTKAGRIEDALLARDAASAVGEIKLANLAGVEDLRAPSMKVVSNVTKSVRRSGRLRGYGRITGMKPAGAEFDLSKFGRYDDFVEIAGGQHDFLILRENGDVLNEKGDTVGTDAVSIIPSGYRDSKGTYHATTGLRIPDSAQPLLAVDHVQLHGLALRVDGTIHGWKDEYETGKRTIPDHAKTGIKQIGCRRSEDWVLTSGGELFRWDIDGEIAVPATIQRGIARLETSAYHSAFVLTEDMDLFDLEGNRPVAWRDKAKNVLVGGSLWAVLGRDDQWHSFVLDGTDSIGNETQVLDVVLNRGETIDVAFHTYAGKDIFFANYVLWIEEAGAPELDFKNLKALKEAAGKKKTPGKGFFGIPIE